VKEIPLTFLLIEVLGLMQESIDELGVYDTLTIALRWAGLLTEGEELTEGQAHALLDRINQGAEQGGGEEPRSQAPRSTKRTFASEFVKTYGKMSVADKCLYAAGYDFEVARQLYCVYDKELSEEIIKSRFDADFARMQVSYEAVVFGMGGSFGGSSSNADVGEVTDFAPDPGDSNYIDAAQNFVNMQHSFRGRKK